MASRRKILVLGSSGLGAVALVGVVAFFVVQVLGDRRATSALNERKMELRGQYEKDPFPTSLNLRGETNNLGTLQAELERLLAAMSESQVEAEAQTPEWLSSQYHETRQRLEKDAKSNAVTVAADYAFGFDRLKQGFPPAQADVRRLTQQLQIVEGVCSALYASRIVELRGIGREEFEQVASDEGGSALTGGRALRSRGGAAAVANVRNPDAGRIPAGALYGTWHFTLEFTAKEAALIEVLNRLARCKVFAAVTKLEVNGDNQVLTVNAAAARAAEVARTAAVAAGTTPPDEEEQDDAKRLLTGTDTLLTVRMDVDVYVFQRPAAKGATPGKSRTASGG